MSSFCFSEALIWIAPNRTPARVRKQKNLNEDPRSRKILWGECPQLLSSLSNHYGILARRDIHAQLQGLLIPGGGEGVVRADQDLFAVLAPGLGDNFLNQPAESVRGFG